MMHDRPPKPARLIDVAMRAGVGRAAAAQALYGGGGSTTRVSLATAKRIRAAARQLDYRPNAIARQLKGAASGIIGVLIGTEAPQVTYRSLIEIERHAYERGYRLMVAHVRADAERFAEYMADFKARNVDGVICLSSWPLKHLEGYYDERLWPAASVFTDEPALQRCASVVADRTSGLRQAVAHLHARGRSRIGLAVVNLKEFVVRQRVDGYRQGIDADEGHAQPPLIWSDDSGDFEPRQERIDDIIDQLVDHHGADAVITGNDFWAVQLIKQLHRRGLRVPDDVAVIGFDNIDVATAVEPELTTIDFDMPLAARHLIDLVVAGKTQGGWPQQAPSVMVPTRLVVRQST
jgi:LacI family transcriptional regulator